MIISSNTISNLSYNPLFSCIVTLYTLILLYFPQSLKLSLSPVLILTVLLLLFLLRLGTVQRRLQSPNPESNIESKENTETKENTTDIKFSEAEKSGFLLTQVDKWVSFPTEAVLDPDPNPDFERSFVEWDVSAPLEVIYEAYEGEENGDNPNVEGPGSDPTRFVTLDRYPSLSMYYPETDSDTSSDGGFPMAGKWDSPESVCFKWEEEDREGLLIEIALDSIDKMDFGLSPDPGPDLDLGLGLDLDLDFHAEEENLIEIDISPAKNDDVFSSSK